MHFRGNYKANIQKASLWWKRREQILEGFSDQIKSISSVQESKRIKVRLKTFGGRGRRTAPWVQHVHAELLDEFDWFRKAVVKFSPALLRTLACHLIKNSSTAYNENYVDPFDGNLIISKIKPSWIQHFQEKHNIVMRFQTGKLMCSPENNSKLNLRLLTI